VTIISSHTTAIEEECHWYSINTGNEMGLFETSRASVGGPSLDISVYVL
jgi:hypothetical protein